MLTNKIYNDKNFKFSPYIYLTKKYFLKRKKNKYKDYRNLLVVNVYSTLYQHKIYSVNYYIDFLKILNTNKINKFNASQFYFFNFSGLLKQMLLKNTYMYSIFWRKQKNNQLAFKNNSYYFNTYSSCSLSRFILSNNSKDVIKAYNINYSTKINNYKNNLLCLEKSEYLKTLNYGNLINLNISNKKIMETNKLNIYYKRWWKALWTNNSINTKINFEQKFFLNLLNIIMLKYFLKNKLFSNLFFVYVIFKSYYMIQNKNNK